MIEINLEAKKEQIYKLIEFIKKYNYKVIEEIIFENINNKNDEDIMSNIKQRCKNNIGYLHYYIINHKKKSQLADNFKLFKVKNIYDKEEKEFYNITNIVKNVYLKKNPNLLILFQ